MGNCRLSIIIHNISSYFSLLTPHDRLGTKVTFLSATPEYPRSPSPPSELRPEATVSEKQLTLESLYSKGLQYVQHFGVINLQQHSPDLFSQF